MNHPRAAPAQARKPSLSGPVRKRNDSLCSLGFYLVHEQRKHVERWGKESGATFHLKAMHFVANILAPILRWLSERSIPKGYIVEVILTLNRIYKGLCSPAVSRISRP